jgi:hypothetical protein
MTKHQKMEMKRSDQNSSKGDKENQERAWDKVEES